MLDQDKGLVAAGAARVTRHQRVLWWVFVANLVLGALGAHEAAHTLNDSIGHSLAGRLLFERFDVGMFFELVDRPQVNLLNSHGMSLLSSVLFFLFMLFVAGGIVSVYFEDRKFNTGEFFAASGGFFWRFVRLMLISLIPLAVLGFLHGLVHKLSNYVDDRALSDKSGFYVLVTGAFVLTLLALCVRLWFDIAQVRAVALNERGMWRNTWRSAGILRSQWGKLLRVYFCIAFFAWAVLAIGLWIWTLLPAKTVLLTFLLLELILLALIASRLWQRASAVVWYERFAPVEVVETSVIKVIETVPEPGAIELPPSQAPADPVIEPPRWPEEPGPEPPPRMGE